MPEVEIVKMLKALADPNRLAIMEMIGNDEICSCKLLENLSISQPTLSHHLRILSDCGLIVGRKEAQWIYYSINREKLAKARNYIANAFIKPIVIEDPDETPEND